MGASAATQLAALVEAARLLSSSLPLDGVLDALQAQARELLGADGAAIHLVAPDRRNFVRRLATSASRSGAPVEVGELLRPDDFIAEAIATARVAFAPDGRHDPRLADEVGRATQPAVSSLVAPLIASRARSGRPARSLRASTIT
jgi:GAF domain-containing protein